jgi:hypothetical protein
MAGSNAIAPTLHVGDVGPVGAVAESDRFIVDDPHVA